MSQSAGVDAAVHPTKGDEHWVSEEECEAMRLLFQDGRGYGELAFILERQEGTVRRHVDRECWHEEDWHDERPESYGLSEMEPSDLGL